MPGFPSLSIHSHSGFSAMILVMPFLVSSKRAVLFGSNLQPVFGARQTIRYINCLILNDFGFTCLPQPLAVSQICFCLLASSSFTSRFSNSDCTDKVDLKGLDLGSAYCQFQNFTKKFPDRTPDGPKTPRGILHYVFICQLTS